MSSPWEICTCTGNESCSNCATITPEALQYLQGLAEEAERDIAALPESSQPLWYRERNRT